MSFGAPTNCLYPLSTRSPSIEITSIFCGEFYALPVAICRFCVKHGLCRATRSLFRAPLGLCRATFIPAHMRLLFPSCCLVCSARGLRPSPAPVLCVSPHSLLLLLFTTPSQHPSTYCAVSTESFIALCLQTFLFILFINVSLYFKFIIIGLLVCSLSITFRDFATLMQLTSLFFAVGLHFWYRVLLLAFTSFVLLV